LEPGTPANLVVIDPESKWTVARFRSKAQNNPFLGEEMHGRVVGTVYAGRMTFQADLAHR
jgi:dihydroorotase